MPYNPAADAAGASNFVEGLTKDERLGAAYNALAQSQGPVAAYGLIDPEGVIGAAKGAVAQQTIPQQVQQVGATLAGTQAQTGLTQAQTAEANVKTKTGQMGLDTIAQLKGIGMMRAVTGPDGTVDADSARHLLSNPAYGIAPEQIEPIVSRMAQPGGSAILDSMERAVRVGGKTEGVTYGKGPDGKPVALVRDNFGVHTQDLGGVTPTQVENADTGLGRLPIAQQNADAHSLSASAAMLTAKNPTQTIVGADGQVYTLTRQARTAGVQPQSTGIQSVQGPAGTQAKAGATVVGKAQGANTANHLPENVAIARADLGQMDLQYGRTFDALGKAEKLVTPLTTGYGGRVATALGSPQVAALENQIQTAKSNIALVTANMSRQGGKSSAIPVRNMQEFKAYQDALGAINPHAAPSVVRDQIATAQRSLQNLQSGVHTMYQAKYGDSLGMQPPAPSGGGWSIKQVP